MADSEGHAHARREEGVLRRTHPATVAVRTAKMLWQMLLGVVAVVVFGSVGGGDAALPIIAIAGIAMIVVLFMVGIAWLSWWRFEYGIVGTDLLIVQGLIVRSRRTIPIARVHGVNVKADPLMRVLGLVELVVQTAGGGANEPEARIGSIPLDQAEELRNALLYDTPGPVAAEMELHAGAPRGTTAEQLVGRDPVGRISDFRGAFGGTEVRGREIRYEHKVPLGRLIVGAATSNRVPLILAFGFAGAAQAIEIVGRTFVERTASRAAEIALPVLVALVLAIGLLVVVVATAIGVARDFGFTARRYETRIETEAGLLERRQISMPVPRIQAVRIEESFLRRLLGLATVHVDTAGLERSGQQARQVTSSKAMVPVARAEEVPALMHGLLPEAEVFPRARAVPGRALRFYLILPTSLAALVALAVVGPAVWFVYRPGLPWALGAVVLVALLTALVRRLQWRRAGAGTNDVAVTLRSGVLGVKRVRLERSRIQSLAVRQNPFQRRVSLASLRTISVSGSSKATYGVSHLDEAEALRIMRWYEDGLARPRSG